MEQPRTRELITAARVADALVYAAGVAGVVAGGLLFRDGEVGFALVAWVLTFIAGGALRLASWAVRALADLLARTSRIEEDIARLAAHPRDHDEARPPAPGAPPDPYRRWGGWH